MTSHPEPVDVKAAVELLKRLRAVESNNAGGIFGLCTNWHRNPDGPEAADVIQSQAARIAELEGFVGSLAEIDLAEGALNYTAVNTLHARGSLCKQVRGETVVAIRTLRDILAAARSRQARSLLSEEA